jgi:hypothetical protein
MYIESKELQAYTSIGKPGGQIISKNSRAQTKINSNQKQNPNHPKKKKTQHNKTKAYQQPLLREWFE